MDDLRYLKFESANTVIAHHTRADVAANDFENKEWNKAHPIEIERYWSGAEAPASRHAEARIIRSDAALCVRFICQQQEMLVVSATPQRSAKTVGLWDRDVCEIFVAPDAREPERYLEFEAAPTGEWIDLGIHVTPTKRETDWDFHSGMTNAAQVSDGIVKIAMRIPWSAFGRRPQSGERWRANLFRCVGKDPGRGYLAWQPTRTPQPNFHVPEAFGWIKF